MLQAMYDLNYAPSAAARSLKLGNSRLFGVIFPPSHNPIYSQYAEGILETAHAAGYSVVLCKPDMGSRGEAEVLRILHEQRVAGIMMQHVEWQARTHLAALRSAGVHVVALDQAVPGCDRVTIDNFAAMDRAVEHLSGLGHSRIGLVSGPIHLSSERERLGGYRRAMRRRGLAVQRHLQSVAGGFTDGAGIQAGNQVIRGAPTPTALIVSSSDLTPGVLSAISQAGLRVPQDLALVGVGDLSWTPTLLSPITSLIEPARQMGADACRLLLRRLESDDERVPLLLEADGEPAHLSYVADLSVRLSCGAPRSCATRDSKHLTLSPLLGLPPSRARLSPDDPVSAGCFHSLGIPKACPI